jgi:hypothetical protein
MHRQFIEELAQKGHNDSIRETASNLIEASDEDIISFLKDLASSRYCSCNYCEEKTAAKIVLKDMNII